MPSLDPFKAAIDAMLIEDATAPRKQRHTAHRILARLVEEHGAEELSYSTVRDYVGRRATCRQNGVRRVRLAHHRHSEVGARHQGTEGEALVPCSAEDPGLNRAVLEVKLFYGSLYDS